MPPAIRVENLGKSYRVGRNAASRGYRTLRESLVDAAKAPLRRLRRRDHAEARDEVFWALRGVDFEVQPGEVIGIIGRNGAGKSTLLKVLSRITKPTTGRVELRGRVGSLLEVGTGFHPELTGRENIYLNGSILGMKRTEIARKFDAIVAFAGVERFLDTPVKRYSSGMYVRLAFAVAAHLEPSIILVDEVLAVGDASFQKKCLEKMGEIGREGRTVLFISHNMLSVGTLCSRGILMDGGRVTREGDTPTILAAYEEGLFGEGAAELDLVTHPNRAGSSQACLTIIRLLNESAELSNQFRIGSPMTVEIEFALGRGVAHPNLGIVVKNSLGSSVLWVNSRSETARTLHGRMHQGRISCLIDRVPMMPGNYTLDLYFGDDKFDMDVIANAIEFRVEAADVLGHGKLPPAAAGPWFWPASWEFSGSPL